MIRFLKAIFRNGSLRISLAYIIFATLWILLSDRIISHFTDSVRILTVYSNIKGVFFVVFTGVMLFILINRQINDRNKIIAKLDREVVVREQLIQELHHRIKNNMQVVLSLIHIETLNMKNPDDLNRKISNKMLSMMSIFNIVYNLKDMTNISLGMVIEEYVRISFRNLTYDHSGHEPKHSVETITSLMLVLDALIEVFCPEEDSIGKISLKLLGPNKIEIGLKRIAAFSEIRKEDMDYLEMQLMAIEGRLKPDEKENTLTLMFREF